MRPMNNPQEIPPKQGAGGEYNEGQFEAEVAQFMRESGSIANDIAVAEFLNNLYANLPGGGARQMARFRKIGMEAAIKEGKQAITKEGITADIGNVDRMHKDLDEVVSEMNIDESTMTRLLTAKPKIGEPYDNDVKELLKEIYMRMRRKGYSHKELVS